MVINLIQWCNDHDENTNANRYIKRMDEFYPHLDLIEWDDFLSWNLVDGI